MISASVVGGVEEEPVVQVPAMLVAGQDPVAMPALERAPATNGGPVAEVAESLAPQAYEEPILEDSPEWQDEPLMEVPATSAGREAEEEALTTQLEGTAGGRDEKRAAEVPVRPWWRVLVKRWRRRSPPVSPSREPSRAEPVDGLRLFRFAVDSLARLATELDASDAEDTDLILVVPAGRALVIADPDELVEAALLSGGICVGASAEPLASQALAEQVESAVAEVTGSPVPRCHPYPYGLVGSAGPLRLLLADLADGGSDADRLATAVLSGLHDVVLDISSQIFHVLDGTGTDVVLVAGRAHAGNERPLVLIDLSPDARGLAVIEHDQVDGRARDQSLDVGTQPSRGLALSTFAVDSLAQLSAQLHAADADDTDLVLVLPANAAVVTAEPGALLEAARTSGGICVAASPVALASASVAQQVERAVAEATGSPVLCCHPYPYGMIGPAGALHSLLADLPEWGSDADRLTTAVLSGRHDVVLDIASQFFHVLDGTGTDVAMVDGQAQVGEERPLVLIDPNPDAEAVTFITAAPVDESARDLGRLLRYDGAVARGDEVTAAAPDVLVTPLWTPEFCATVIRAAEAGALWVNLTDGLSATMGVWLQDLIPHLLTLLETDIDDRIWPMLRTEWPTLVNTDLRGARILRFQAGRPVEDSGGHHDLAQLSGSVRLNDGYHGGALVLPRQDWDDSAVPVGALTVWPSLAAHPSETTPVTSGVKYRLALWWRLAGA